VPNRASLPSRGAGQSIPSQRDRLVTAAVALADREGLPAVSIRRVAAELAVRPMSIYTYITSKDELLDLMAEAVVSEVLVTPPLPSDWREAVETIAVQSHQVFIAHPWLAAISHQRPDLGANALHHAEQLLAAIAPLDLTTEEAWEVLFLINDYTLGHALRIAHAPPPTAGKYPPFDPQQFPHLAATVHRARRRSDDTFQAGLGRILDGIANARPSASAPERRGSRTSAANPSTPKRARRAKQNSGTGG
jgi:AcrR family transcriptional regulator